MKKRFFASLAVLALMACLAATAAFAMDVTTVNQNVNLRRGPGTQYERLAIIPSGERVYVVAADTGNGWTQVEYKEQVGYVVTRYLASAASAGGTYTTTANLNLRQGAGTSSKVLALIPKGTVLSVSSLSGGWGATSYNGLNGYVSAQYLKAGGTAGADVSHATTANLNLRQSAGTGSKVLAVIPKGTAVAISSVSGGWAKVSYGGQSGYVSTNYLTGFTGTAAPADTAVTTGAVNLRKTAGAGGKVLTVIPKGAAITVHSTGNGWAKVTYNGTTGYVYAKYISTSGSAGNAAANTAAATTNVNLRKSAGTDSAVLALVPKGASVTVHSVSGGWAKASYNGKTGYIFAKYLSGLGSTYTATANLNLRKGPGTGTKVLLVIPKGAKLDVAGSANGWATVTYQGRTGYVSTRYVSGLGA